MLTNIVKHARATQAEVRLELDAAGLRIAVNGIGIGFAPALPSPSIGLVGMRECVYALEGRIAIHTGLTAGPRIDILLPV